MFENARSWWRRNKEMRSFFEAFVDATYYEIKGCPVYVRGKRRRIRYPLKTKLGQDLLKNILPRLWDSLHERDLIDNVFRFNENQYLAGLALHYSFFGYNFSWVEEHGPDKIEPMRCNEIAMNRAMYNKYEDTFSELAIEEVRELCEAEVEARAEAEVEADGDGRRRYRRHRPRDLDESIEEGYCMKGYFSSMAKPLCDFDVGERIVFNSSLEYIVDNDEVFVSLYIPESFEARVRRGMYKRHYPLREILQKVYWKGTNLPFYAWDIGLADGPVDE